MRFSSPISLQMGKPHEDYSCAQELHFLHEDFKWVSLFEYADGKKNLMKNSCVKELHILHEISFKRFHSLNLQIGKKSLIRKKNSRVSTEELQSSSARD
jgi:hypothetical protein